MIVIKYILLLGIYLLNIWDDAKSDARKLSVHHTRESWELAAIISIITVLLEVVFARFVFSWPLLWFTIADLIFFCCLRFALFNPIINYYKGMPLNYISNKEPGENQSKIDTVLFRYKDYQWHLRVLFLALSIALLVTLNIKL